MKKTKKVGMTNSEVGAELKILLLRLSEANGISATEAVARVYAQVLANARELGIDLRIAINFTSGDKRVTVAVSGGVR